MNPDLLSQLQDIQTPEEIGMWPLAWGWWVTIFLTITIIALIVTMLVRRHRLLKAKKQALNILSKAKGHNATDKVKTVHDVLKRVLLAYQERDVVAHLAGTDLATWLNKHDAKFQVNAELFLLPYQSQCDEQQAELHLQQVMLWINKAMPLKPVTFEESTHV